MAVYDDLWEKILTGALVGAIPTVSMILMSLFVFNTEISKTFEATAQFFCAGLILGAVGKELFPQLGKFSDFDDTMGLTIGFICGFLLINYQDSVITLVENICNCFYETPEPSKSSKTKTMSGENQSLLDKESNSSNKVRTEYRSISSDDGHASGAESEAETEIEEGEHPILLLGSQVISSPTERTRIREKVSELVNSIHLMQRQAQVLFEITPKNNTMQIEVLADQIDEEIHKLQYYVDHCRRLLQGSGSNVEALVPRIWITEKGKKALQNGLAELHEGASSIAKYLTDDEHLSKSALIAMHDTMGNMDHQIHHLHHTVENYSLKWGRRLKKRVIPIPTTGSYIPMDLLIPVTVDCIVDGFLLGTTTSISTRAGIILGAANCIEMGFLGLAVSVRIQKCTASSLCSRYLALILPPCIMLGSSVLGSYLGFMSTAYPMAFVAFIAFGIVALLYLALNELLVEAKEAIKGEESWYSGLVLFVGVYLVIIMDLYLP